MIFDIIFEFVWWFIDFAISLLPAMPSQPEQIDAMWSGFAYVDMVIDVSWVATVGLSLTTVAGAALLMRFFVFCLNLIKGWL